VAGRQDYDPRGELLQVLLEKVVQDRHPSITMMNLIEELLTPQEVPSYAEVLMDKIRSERFPSISMMLRARSLG